MRLVRASMTIISYFHKVEISPFHCVSVEMTLLCMYITII